MTTASVREVAPRDAARALLGHHLARAPLAQVVRRLGTVQVDPLAPMGRNHDLVLQARVDGYRIDDWHGPAYRDRVWLDGWDKQACLTPAADWPVRRLFHDHFAARWAPFLARHDDAVQATLARLAHDGPASALAFEDGPRAELRGSWYGPRLVKHVLRALWDTGRVVTVGREAGRHVYDVTPRGLPASARRAPGLDDGAALQRLLVRRVQAAGALRVGADRNTWTAPVPVPATERRAALERAVAEGRLEGWRVAGRDYVATPGLLDAAPPVDRALARVLGPLDAVLWDRKGVAELFGFDYVWEVYKPAAKRRWGYYVVPVVWGDRFVARFDGRREGGVGGRLRVAGWWWEVPATDLDGAARDALVAGLARFLAYLEVARVTLPRGLDRATRSMWHAAARAAPAWAASEGRS